MIAPLKPQLLNRIPKFLLQEPFELLLAFMCFVSGFPYVLGAKPIDNVTRQIPTGFIVMWGLCLVAGGFMLLFGIITYKSYIQRAGLSLLSPTSFVYAILLVYYVGKPALFSCAIIIAFSLACLLKDYMIKIATKSIVEIFGEVETRGDG